jgi:hypothetical protein
MAVTEMEKKHVHEQNKSYFVLFHSENSLHVKELIILFIKERISWE